MPSEPSIDFDYASLDRNNPAEVKLSDAYQAGLKEGADEMLRWMVRMLLFDNPKPALLALRVHVLINEAGLHPAMPQTQAALAEAAGVSQSQVSKATTQNISKWRENSELTPISDASGIESGHK